MNAAAELLRKGGTLVTEVCSNCKGVQIKYSGRMICANCGKEEYIKVESMTKTTVPVDIIKDLKDTILAKIGELLPLLKSETSIGRQAELARLIRDYMEVLERMPEDKESRQ